MTRTMNKATARTILFGSVKVGVEVGVVGVSAIVDMGIFQA